MGLMTGSLMRVSFELRLYPILVVIRLAEAPTYKSSGGTQIIYKINLFIFSDYIAVIAENKNTLNE